MMKLILVMSFLFVGTIGIPAHSNDFTLNADAAEDLFTGQRLLPPLQAKDIKINTFDIAPRNLAVGQEAELIWKVNGAARIFIDNNSDLKQAEVSPTGHLTVTPLKTTTYILTAYDHHMIGASAVATIEVYGRAPEPLVSLKADTHTILAGEKATLKWETRFANTVSIDNGIGAVGSYGVIDVTPLVTTTYTLAATGLGGSKIANITITVVTSRAAIDSQ